MDIVGVTPLPARLETGQVVEVELTDEEYANLRNYFKPELIASPPEPDPPEQPTDPESPPENPEPAKKPRGRPRKTAEPKPTE